MTGPARIELLYKHDFVGLDFVRVSGNQLELSVFLHHKSPFPPSLQAKFAALGPKDVEITAAGKVVPTRTPVKSVSLESENSDAPEKGRHFFLVKVLQPGGFGNYRLKINHPCVDSYFNNIEFTFKASCESGVDCREVPTGSAKAEGVDFPVDYRARDFWSFRQALLDFAAQRYLQWQDRLEADLGVAVVEMLSALGDEFAYAQDRIARELHLETASQRRSLRHLARLVDYQIDNGSGARVWLDIKVEKESVPLPGGTAVCDADGESVFEIGHGLYALDGELQSSKTFTVTSERNSFDCYLWDEGATTLAAGSTSLAIKDHHAAAFAPDEEIDPDGRTVLLVTSPDLPQQPRRLLVRIPSGGAKNSKDKLTGAKITTLTWEEPTPFDVDLATLEVHGNLVPATSGNTSRCQFSIGRENSSPPKRTIERVGANGTLSYDEQVPEDGRPRKKFLFSLPGSDLTPLVWLPDENGQPRPEVLLWCCDDSGGWKWKREMIGAETADATDKVFTLEDGFYRRVFGVDRAGTPFELEDYSSNAGATIRFGDGEFGKVPDEGTIFDVHYRLGNGRLMNVAADTLIRFAGGHPPEGVSTVSNPFPAEGGRDPEPDETVRFNAPQAFRAQSHRAVRLEDFDEIVARDLSSWVQRSGSVMRWTGSWSTVFVTPDPHDELGLTSEHRRDLESLIDRIRQAGREAKVLDPRYAKVVLEIEVTAAPNAYAGEVTRGVLAALLGDVDGKGFFHPDNFSFGMPLSRGALLAAVQEVPGVFAVGDIYVSRPGVFAKRLFSEFLLPVGINEVIAVEPGAVTLVMGGGA